MLLIPTVTSNLASCLTACSGGTATIQVNLILKLKLFKCFSISFYFTYRLFVEPSQLPKSEQHAGQFNLLVFLLVQDFAIYIIHKWFLDWTCYSTIHTEIITVFFHYTLYSNKQWTSLCWSMHYISWDTILLSNWSGSTNSGKVLVLPQWNDSQSWETKIGLVGI